MNIIWLILGSVVGYLVATQVLLMDQDEEGDEEDED